MLLQADRTALMKIVSTTVAALERDAAGGRSTKAAGRVSVADANKVSLITTNDTQVHACTVTSTRKCTSVECTFTSDKRWLIVKQRIQHVPSIRFLTQCVMYIAAHRV
jgi:hypothetical protein